MATRGNRSKRCKRRERRGQTTQSVVINLVVPSDSKDVRANLLAILKSLLKLKNKVLINGKPLNRKTLESGSLSPESPGRKTPTVLLILPGVDAATIETMARGWFVVSVFMVRPSEHALATAQAMFGSAVHPPLDFDPAKPGPFEEAIRTCVKHREPQDSQDSPNVRAIKCLASLPFRCTAVRNKANLAEVFVHAISALKDVDVPYFLHHHWELYAKAYQMLWTIRSQRPFLVGFRNLVRCRIDNWADGPVDVRVSLVRFYQECNDRHLLMKTVLYLKSFPHEACLVIVCTAEAEDPRTTLVNMLDSQKVASLCQSINQQTQDTKHCKNCSRYPRAPSDKSRLSLFRTLLISRIPIRNTTRHAEQGYRHTISENTAIAVLLRIACTHKMTWIQQESIKTLRTITHQQWWTFVQTLTDRPADQELKRYLYCVHCELKVLLDGRPLEKYLQTLALYCENWIKQEFMRYLQTFPTLHRLVCDAGGISDFLDSSAPTAATAQQFQVIDEKYRVFRHDHRSFSATRSYDDVGVDTNTCECCWINETTPHARDSNLWDDGVCVECIDRRCRLEQDQPIGPGHCLHPVNQQPWKKPTRKMMQCLIVWTKQIEDNPNQWPRKLEDIFRCQTHYCGLCSHDGCRKAVRREARQCHAPIFWHEIPSQYRPADASPAAEIPTETLQTFGRDMRARLDPDLQRRIHNSICLATGRISEMILAPAACPEHDRLKLTPDMRECPGCGQAVSHDGACLSTYCHCGVHFCIHCMQDHGYGVGCFPMLQDAYAYRGGRCRWCHEHVPFADMCTHDCAESEGEFQRLYWLYFDDDGKYIGPMNRTSDDDDLWVW